NLRTEACDERSAMNVATVASLLAAALMRADAMRVLVLLRPTMARFAPSAASASAAANPMPLVAPVIRICLSFTAQQSKAMAHARNACSNTCAGLVGYLFETATRSRAYVATGVCIVRANSTGSSRVRGRYCSNYGLALSALRFCRRRHRGSNRHGWRFSDDAVADTAFRGPSAHGGGNRLALRRRDENGWHRDPLQEGERGLARGRTLGRRIGPPHGAHPLGPVPGAEAEPDHSDYHIHVDGGGTDHRGRGDLLSRPYPRLRPGPR